MIEFELNYNTIKEKINLRIRERKSLLKMFKARMGLGAHGHANFVHHFFRGSVGFNDILSRVFFDGMDNVFGVGHVSKVDDNGTLAPIVFADLLYYLVATHAGEHNVHEYGIGAMLEREGDAFSTNAGSEHGDASQFKCIRVEFAEVLVVLDDEYRGLTHILVS